VRSKLLLAAIGFLAVSFAFSMLYVQQTDTGATTRVVEAWMLVAGFWIGILCVAALLLDVVLEGRNQA